MCESGDVTGVPCEWAGPQEGLEVVEWVPEFLRASHEAAGNSGVYPYNGAVRLRVCTDCAESIKEAE